MPRAVSLGAHNIIIGIIPSHVLVWLPRHLPLLQNGHVAATEDFAGNVVGLEVEVTASVMFRRNQLFLLIVCMLNRRKPFDFWFIFDLIRLELPCHIKILIRHLPLLRNPLHLYLGTLVHWNQLQFVLGSETGVRHWGQRGGLLRVRRGQVLWAAILILLVRQ